MDVGGFYRGVDERKEHTGRQGMRQGCLNMTKECGEGRRKVG